MTAYRTDRRATDRDRAPSEATLLSCAAVLRKKTLEETTGVCPECGHHHKITAWQRLDMLSDPGTFEEWDRNLVSQDPLGFGQEYLDKLAKDRAKTKLTDAVLTGRCTLDGRGMAIGIMDFRFRGGSMGSVVGERISRLLERAIERRLPSVVVTSSGGARMQESLISLMQMARTSAALTKLSEAKLPFITVLIDPCMGGVSASLAMLGDVIIAEPKALIGFAGPRVIEQIVRETLPEGFQRSEFLVEHGAVDMIVDRRDLRSKVAGIISKLCNLSDPNESETPKLAETSDNADAFASHAEDSSVENTA